MKEFLQISLVLYCMTSSAHWASSKEALPENILGTYIAVDDYFRNGTLLTKQLNHKRELSEKWDRPIQYNDDWSFGRAIATEVINASRPRKADLETWYLNTFSIPLSHKNDTVSLTEEKMCTHSKDDFDKIFRKGRLISEVEIKKVNDLVDIHNRHVDDQDADTPIHLHALFGCLAYTESLGDPDTDISNRRAKILLGDDFEKPAGVKFYYDYRHRKPRSRWNIGLYQFVAHSRGNIGPCVAGWNKDIRDNPNLPIGDLKGLAPFMGSAGQTLNAYCGVHKILETFFVQKYTTDSSRVHPNNIKLNGKLKKPIDRCVSLHASFAYRHFGPLDRSDGRRTKRHLSNLDKVLSCTLNTSKIINGR